MCMDVSVCGAWWTVTRMVPQLGWKPPRNQALPPILYTSFPVGASGLTHSGVGRTSHGFESHCPCELFEQNAAMHELEASRQAEHEVKKSLKMKADDERSKMHPVEPDAAFGAISKMQADAALEKNFEIHAGDPERAVTLILTRTLGDILNTDVGPDPWPFVGLPDVSVDVRVARMLGSVDGTFQLSGQFFVASEATTFRDSSHSFEITVPMTDATVGSIAAAQSAALLSLAEQIAATLGR